MDFGDILNRWNRSNEIVDKDRQSGQEEHGKAENRRGTSASGGEYRRRLRNKKPDAVIDIHGHTRDEAWEVMSSFFDNAGREGLEKILVIHGKGIHSQGEAVLKRTVKEFIERCPFAGESGQDKTGGSGATWVLLKQKR